jgi:O-succinylbenzoate synthase
VRILHHRYTLEPGPVPWQALMGPRQGALLRVEFDDGSIGHADLHPWPEFGQEPLDRQLDALASGAPTTQGAIALRHARTDAAARRAGLSLFAGLPAVGSHALFTDWTCAPRSAFEACSAEGFRAAKLKVGRDPVTEASALNGLAGVPLRWRLDANGLFTARDFREWIRLLNDDVRRAIEFIEDPCPYDPEAWANLSEETGLALALDWQLPDSPPPWPGNSVLVLKPSAQEVFPLASAAAAAGLKIVVTHSLDHPLGRAIAMWTAMRLRQRHGDAVLEGGLGSTDLAPPEGWPLAPDPGGTGFGFDDLLAVTRWQSI